MRNSYVSYSHLQRLELLGQYLATRCHERNAELFASPGVPPTETTVLERLAGRSLVSLRTERMSNEKLLR
jgi:hypothetical protein